VPLTGNLSEDIAELRGTFKRKGKIGNTRPRNKEHARRISIAIAFDKKRDNG